jgi:CheY-like chemotaxis protein
VRILVVEDSPLVTKMYGLAFSQRQNELVTAANGRAGLEILDRQVAAFDLILLDLRMPDMNGVEFLRELQRRGCPTPVILTTGEAEGSPMVADAMALGPAALVSKPWKPLELREVASRIIEGEPA